MSSMASSRSIGSMAAERTCDPELAADQLHACESPPRLELTTSRQMLRPPDVAPALGLFGCQLAPEDRLHLDWLGGKQQAPRRAGSGPRSAGRIAQPAWPLVSATSVR